MNAMPEERLFDKIQMHELLTVLISKALLRCCVWRSTFSGRQHDDAVDVSYLADTC
jgi:hypothetical protein